MSNDLILHSTDASFEKDVLQSNVPVLVDFWAEWCRPCQAIMPILDGFSEDYKDKVKVCKIDIETNADITAKFGIQNIPTLLLFKEGNMIASTPGGNMTKAKLSEFVEKNI